jgi:hypothetical protein
MRAWITREVLRRTRSGLVTVTVYKDDSFSVTPEQNLQPGEYLLVFGHANTGFDFGIAKPSNR